MWAMESLLQDFGLLTSKPQHMYYNCSGSTDETVKLLHGVKRGDRVLKMKIYKPIMSHIMCGDEKVKVTYEGQPKTCFRCSQLWTDCPGNGNIDACQKNGGNKVEISETWAECGVLGDSDL